MIITKIEKKDQKYRIFIDDEYAFSLYYTELKKFNIETDHSIDPQTIHTIYKDIVIKRGTTYLYHLLSKKDYTYIEFQNKLLKAGYLHEQISIILGNFIALGYIDDENYAKRYIEHKHQQKSKMQLMYDLKKKGIHQDIIDRVFEESDFNEYEACKKILEKRLRNKTNLSYEEKNKQFKYLINKGYKTDTIKKTFQIYKM